MKVIRLDRRALAAAFYDGVALLLAGYTAAILTAGEAVPAGAIDTLGTIAMIAVPTQIAVHFLFGVYQGIWRYTSLPDIQRVLFSVLTGTVVIATMLRVGGLDAYLNHREYILFRSSSSRSCPVHAWRTAPSRSGCCMGGAARRGCPSS